MRRQSCIRANFFIATFGNSIIFRFPKSIYNAPNRCLRDFEASEISLKVVATVAFMFRTSQTFQTRQKCDENVSETRVSGCECSCWCAAGYASPGCASSPESAADLFAVGQLFPVGVLRQVFWWLQAGGVNAFSVSCRARSPS